jgi:hypothetical protein
VGDLLRTVGRYVPPPPWAASPLRWGTLAGTAELFPSGVKLVAAERKHFVFRYESPAHFVEVFRRYYGPTHKAFEALDESGREKLAADLEQLLVRSNRGSRAGIAVPGEYLETLLERSARED